MSDREATSGARRTVEEAFRVDHGKILAILLRDFGDLDLAEDSLQDAFAEALRSWPSHGQPRQVTAWIITTARHRAVDRLRRRALGEKKLEQVASTDGQHDVVIEDMLASEDIPDERLRLIFTCCHPALDRHDAVALTLRTVGGLTTREIAIAFLVKETTMQARLTRAKAKIRKASIPYRVPDHHELPERLATVIDVVLLIYNQGYTPASEDPVIDSLRREAIVLAGVLSTHLPDEPEALGLHALLLFHETRSPARVDAAGELVSLEQQQRTLWLHDLAVHGDELLRRALRMGQPGPCQIQAAISALHSMSSGPEETDWSEIVLLYDRLLAMAPSPTTAIGRAIAVGMAHGPPAGLAALPPPEPPLDTFHRWHAARADLLRRTGELEEAARAFDRAAALASNVAESRWLKREARRCRAPTG